MNLITEDIKKNPYSTLYCSNYDLTSTLKNTLSSLENGIILSAPEILAIRTQVDLSHTYWLTQLSVDTQEIIGIDTQGKFYSPGTEVLLTLHGAGLLTAKKWKYIGSELASGNKWQHYGSSYVTAEYTQEEYSSLLHGKIGKKKDIPIFEYEEIEGESKILPHTFGIVTPYELIYDSVSGEQTVIELLNNPLAITRSANIDILKSYHSIISPYSYNNLQCTSMSKTPQAHLVTIFSKENRGHFDTARNIDAVCAGIKKYSID